MGRALYMGGAAVQASITAALASQALLAPRILGADEYGRALAALALPFLVQAAIETVVFALTIQWTGDAREPELRRLWTNALWAAPLIGIPAVVIALQSAAAPLQARWVFLIGAPLVLGTWAAANCLMGAAYALRRHGAIARTYLFSALLLPAAIFALQRYGAAAFLAAVLLDKLSSIASLWLDRPVCEFVARVLRGSAAPQRPGRLLREYLPVMTPRLTLLLLSPALVAMGAVLLPPAQLAGFKVSLSFVTASASLVPVSQYVLHAHWRDAVKDAEGSIRREVRRVLVAVLLAGLVFSAILLRWGDPLRAAVLRTDDPSLRHFDVIFLAIPLFVLIGPLSSFLIASARTRRLAAAFGASAAAVLAILPAAGPGWGFVGGTVFFVAVACGPLLSPLDR